MGNLALLVGRRNSNGLQSKLNDVKESLVYTDAKTKTRNWDRVINGYMQVSGYTRGNGTKVDDYARGCPS